MEKDLYAILGVNPQADVSEIREQFRRMAKLFHPDVNQTHAERFCEINDAYAVLMSPEHRQAYDHQRATSKGSGTGTTGCQNTVAAPKPDESPSRVEAWFGGGKNSDAQPKPETSGDSAIEGRESDDFEAAYGDLQTDVLVTLNEVLAGTKRVINLRRKGTTDSPRQLSIEIPRGVKNGQVIRLPGKGRTSLSRGTTGDLHVIVRYAVHQQFAVNDSDLIYSLALQAWQFVLGDVVRIPTLTDEMSLRINAGSKPGQRLRIPNLGLPENGDHVGDLIVRLGIELPQTLNRSSKEAWEQVKAASQTRNTP